MNEQPRDVVLEEKLHELLDLAKKNKGIIDSDVVNSIITELNLDNSQSDKIYDKLEANNIVVLNPIGDDDEPADDDLSKVEEDTDDEEKEKKPIYSPSLSGSEDPVHLYLKEIGNYPLLTIEEEVSLSKRIENGDEEAKNI